MKPLFALAISLVMLTGNYQKPGTDRPADDMLYPASAMNKLRHIVDSLNLKFKVCDLNKVYLSKPQARAHHISLEGLQSKTALADMEAGISYDRFLARYPMATVDPDLLTVAYDGKDYKTHEPIVAFSNVNGKGSYSLEVPKDTAEALGDLRGKWVTSFDKYGEGSVQAFYFTENPAQRPIPEKYGRWIQYVDCLVDTTSRIFTEKAEHAGRTYLSKLHPAADALNGYILEVFPRQRGKQKMTDKEIQEWVEASNAWEAQRAHRVDSLQKASSKFRELFAAAVEEAKQLGSDNDYIDEYIERYHSPELALQLKRNRIVVGGCSMDDSPRIHAMNIARLSAETIQWDIFLRAHLDIMNDYFERVSDGSWAQEGRKTYIRELEVLDINVPDLMMGIVLRAGNVNGNHYFGSVGRIGRSITESVNAKEMEARIMDMITDPGLDDYNRAIAYYLFKNYNYYLPDKATQRRNTVSLEVAMKTLPHYLTVNIERE
ncbi:hypothetical protein GCM10010967_43780 [Dyadobacter beijingensis]|uniref:Uncharacterized protein n=1 Tax=Dyadobacter beijingensis TaxID=365489 RepID=A0ABQ2IAF5_9BACT|nr:hypothetical protein [Dyadobacter beijingensis]GGN04129.1 hypothetical protein GCM10010967_43780 [Dyadobacter beijingensis]